jgi:hypothetical protein
MAYRTLEHPAPHCAGLDADATGRRRVKAGRHREKIMNGDVTHAGVDRRFGGFGKDIAQFLLESEISGVDGDPDQDR